MNKLDLSRIQTASPYDIEEVANGVYLFETDHDVLYKIEFGEDASIGNCDTYQFYINNVRHVRAERDTKVKQTVMAVLIEFFRVNASVPPPHTDTMPLQPLTYTRDAATGPTLTLTGWRTDVAAGRAAGAAWLLPPPIKNLYALHCASCAAMKWGIFDAGTKSKRERGSGRIYNFSGRIYKKCIRGRFALARMKNFL